MGLPFMKLSRLLKLIEELSHPDPLKRYRAAEALGYGDERAIYPLIKALRDRDRGVQDAAMRSLISIGGEVTAYMVLPLLRDEPSLRSIAIVILKGIGTSSLPLLRSLLKDKDDTVRQLALYLISEIKVCDYPEDIVKILETDPSPNVRASAARVLGVIKYKEALPQLVNALSGSEWVCFSALESIALIGNESSAGFIVPLLSSESVAIRYAVVEALSMIGGELSLNALLKYLSKAEGFEKENVIKNMIKMGICPAVPGVSEVLTDMLRSGDWGEKIIAIEKLIDLGEKDAVYHIVDLAGSLDPSEPGNEERISIIKDLLCRFGCISIFIDIIADPSFKYRGKAIAIDVIRRLGCREAIPFLMQLLDTDIRDIRRASMEALGDMGCYGAKSAMIKALEDFDSGVRRSAVLALGKLKDKEAFEPILNLLSREKNPEVVEEAIKSLLAIDSERFLFCLSRLDPVLREIVTRYKEQLEWV